MKCNSDNKTISDSDTFIFNEYTAHQTNQVDFLFVVLILHNHTISCVVDAILSWTFEIASANTTGTTTADPRALAGRDVRTR